MGSKDLWKKQCLGVGVALLVTMGAGCSSSNNDDNGTPVIPPAVPGSEEINISGRIILGSSATGGGEGVSGVTVSIKGDQKNNVFNGSGQQVSQFTTDETGLVGFHMRNIDSSDFPVKLKVVASHPDYESSGTTVDVTKNGDTNFNISLVDMSEPPAGVVAKSVMGSSSDDGVVEADITLNSGIDDSSGGNATMVVTQGTVMTDAAGKPVTGELTATTVYYNNTDETALETFPGGLTGVEVDNYSDNAVTFISGSFASFSIKNDEGDQVKNFSTPVTFKMRVPQSTINPTTGDKVKVGDSLPIWSYDPDTGAWQKEGDDGIVQDDGDEKTYYVEASIDHLSYWNLDWPAQTCDLSGQWNVPGGEGHNIRLRITGSGYTQDTFTNGDGFIRYWNAPQNVPVKITAYLSGIKVGELDNIVDLCAGGSVPINIPADQAFSDITVTVNQMCTEDNSVTTPIPSVSVYFGGEPIGSTNSNGQVIALNRFVPKNNVKVQAYNRITNKWLTQHVDVTQGSSVTFSVPVACTDVTGGGSTTGGGDVTGGNGAG